MSDQPERRLCEPNRLWKRDDVAHYLQISTSYVEKLTAKGLLKCIRIGRSVSYAPADVAEFARQLARREVEMPMPAGDR